MINIPSDFVHTITVTFGNEGVAWLQRLPALVDACAARWHLALERPFALSYNYVAPATRADGSNVVLKVGCPSPESITERAALRLYNGRGVARLLDSDEDLGAMLIERVRPGTMLATLDDDERATEIAADVMRQLWRPVPDAHPFPGAAEYTSALDGLRPFFSGGTGPFPPALVDRAERLRAELLASMGEPVVLHGDLHHFNMLTAEREPWLAIDPKGVIGEPTFEVGAFLHNPWPQLHTRGELRHVLHRRVDVLAERLLLDRERVRGWGIVYSLVSAWWSYDEASGHFDGHESLACAQALSE